MRESKADVTCHNCRTVMVKAGYYGKNRVQRFKCQQCGKRLSEPPQTPFNADIRLAPERVAMILKCLAEGNSVRGTARLCEVEKRTVLNLLVVAGEHCQSFMESKIVGLDVFDCEIDEIWGFCGKKESHKLDREKQIETIGDAYCFVAMERNCKLVLTWHLGKRDQLSTDIFIRKLARATSEERYQLTSDGFRPYIKSITRTLRGRVDFGQLVKVYGVDRDGEQRYSPPVVLNAIPTPINGPA